MISDENNYINFVKGLLFYMLLLDLCLDIYLDFFSPSVASVNNFMVEKLMCCFSPGSM